MGQGFELHCGAQQFGVSQHHIAQISCSVFRNHAHKIFGRHLANIDALGFKLSRQSPSDKLAIPNRGDRSHFHRIAIARFVQNGSIQLDGDFDESLAKGRKTCRKDREQQPNQHQQSNDDGNKTIGAEPRFLRVA